MTALLAFLRIILPQVPQMAALFRSAFTKVGGTDADYDKILADNQIDIDRLKGPDGFRHTGPRAPAGTSAASIYGGIIDTIDGLTFKRGDEIYAPRDRSKFFIVRGAYETSPLVPAGFTLYGRFDGNKVVLAEG